MRQMEHVALDRIFYPESIAVIGVSERPDNLAANIVHNLLAFEYQGDVHAVGLKTGEVHGVPILNSVEALPDNVDLAVILTPATAVPGLLRACGKKGIKRAIIESGGFTERSDAGHLLEQEVVAAAHAWDIRFMGPNCISVINLENGLCLPFVRLDPKAIRRGRVSVVAQSGGISITYLILLSEAGLGANKIVSMGNKTDLDEVDYLAYLLNDPTTESLCLYLESMERGRQLLEIAAASSKPIIVQKANRGRASRQIAFSHTAALTSDDVIVDAALRQAGVARALSFDDAVALAQACTLPAVRGEDLLIISRSGGHAVVAADAAEAQGFHLAPIPESFASEARGLFRADVIAPTNPLDLGAIFDFDLYAHIVERGLQALDPDVLLLIHTYSSGPEATMSLHMVRRLEALSRGLETPLALCAFAQRADVEALSLETELPVFTKIESAVRALAASRERHTRTVGLLPLPSTPPQRSDEVEAIVAQAGTLTADRALHLCAAFDVPVETWAVVEDQESAVSAAAKLGYPVALKGLSSRVSHKSDAGLVVLDIADPERLRHAFEEIVEGLSKADHDEPCRRVMVQPMVFGGREVIIGGKRDPNFGPVVMFGLGGVYVEVLRDVVFRLAPLSRDEAWRMLDEIRGRQLLHGVRGAGGVDREAIVDALLCLSDLMVACPEIAELDINPLLVLEQGAAAIDARAVVRSQTA